MEADVGGSCIGNFLELYRNHATESLQRPPNMTDIALIPSSSKLVTLAVLLEGK